MEADFKKILEHIFNNWTALKLAVEHSTAGANSKQIALQTVDYLANYLTTENGLEAEDIEDVLEDIMDQEFNTVCEDDSIKEISSILIKFLELLKKGNREELEIEFSKLPVGLEWLASPASTQENESTRSESPKEADAINDEPMEEDPGWTRVATRKKR